MKKIIILIFFIVCANILLGQTPTRQDSTSGISFLDLTQLTNTTWSETQQFAVFDSVGNIKFRGTIGTLKTWLENNLNISISDGSVTNGKVANLAGIEFAKLQSMNAGLLLGRNSLTNGPPETITIGDGLNLTNNTLTATGGGGTVVAGKQQLAQDGEVLVLFLFGQSNMDGREDKNNLIAAEQDTMYKFLAPQNPNNTTVLPYFYNDYPQIGPEPFLALAIDSLLTDTVLYIKVSEGGESLSGFMPGREDKDGSDQWPDVKASIITLDSIRRRDYPNRRMKVGMLWLQGEADSRADSLAGYTDRLKSFLGSLNDSSTYDIPIYISGIVDQQSSNFARWNDKVAAWCDTTPKAYFIPNSYLDNSYTLDGLHWNRRGYKKIAENFVNLMIDTYDDFSFLRDFPFVPPQEAEVFDSNFVYSFRSLPDTNNILIPIVGTPSQIFFNNVPSIDIGDAGGARSGFNSVKFETSTSGDRRQFEIRPGGNQLPSNYVVEFIELDLLSAFAFRASEITNNRYDGYLLAQNSTDIYTFYKVEAGNFTTGPSVNNADLEFTNLRLKVDSFTFRFQQSDDKINWNTLLEYTDTDTTFSGGDFIYVQQYGGSGVRPLKGSVAFRYNHNDNIGGSPGGGSPSGGTEFDFDFSTLPDTNNVFVPIVGTPSVSGGILALTGTGVRANRDSLQFFTGRQQIEIRPNSEEARDSFTLEFTGLQVNSAFIFRGQKNPNDDQGYIFTRSNSTQWAFWKVTGDSSYSNEVQVTYDAAGEQTRLTVYGDTFEFQTSADGTNWTTRLTYTDSTYSSGFLTFYEQFGGTNERTIDNIKVIYDEE